MTERPALMPVDEAVRRVVDGVVPVGSEMVNLAACFGRVLAEDVKVGGKKVAAAGAELDDEVTAAVLESGVDEVQVAFELACRPTPGRVKIAIAE